MLLILRDWIAMTDENQFAYAVKEGWLNVWEVLCCMDGYSAGRLKEDKHLGPSWEPHLCLLNTRTKKLLHFRSEKAAEEYISRLRDDHILSEPTSVPREWIGPNREDFQRRNNLERSCVSDLLMVADTTSEPPSIQPMTSDPTSAVNSSGQPHHVTPAKLGSFQKSQTLDNRSTQTQLLACLNEAGNDKFYSHSTSVVDKRRGSGSSLCSDESSSKPSQQHQQQNQSKLANFFSRKSQQLKSNLKRTKSATKLDRKKTNGDSDGPLSVYEPEGPASFRTPPTNITNPACDDEDLPDHLKRSASTGRLSKRRVVKPQKVAAKKTLSEASERMSGCMRTSHSHEALLTSPSEVHNSVDLSHPDVTVRPVHSSIWSVEHCFVVSREGRQADGQRQSADETLGVPADAGTASSAVTTKYYRCGSDAEMQRWIVNIKTCIQSNRDRNYRTDNSLQLSIVESKNLPPKKRYYCELCLDGVLYARTSAKLMQDHVFWGEQFNFGELPNVRTISVHLFREVDKKKKRERPFKIGSINIPSSDFKNVPICEKWYEVNSSAGRKGARESRVEGVGVRIKGRYLSVNILPLHFYLPLLEYVQNEYSSLVELLEPVISVKAKEGLATCLASSLHCTGHVGTFLCDIVMAEVDRLENNALALRGNSIATKAVEAYMKIVGQKYLVSTLKDVLRAVIDSTVDCEVDPGRLSTSNSLTYNRQTLVTQCTLVWCKIINSSAFFPSELRRLFQMVRQSCESRSNISVAVCRQLISSCIFLRFFCPAILSPNLFSIIQEFPCDRGVRNLTLIAKTIQSLANLTLFGGKEKFMDFMNSFVSYEMDNMQAYLDNISTFNDDEEQRSCDPIIDQSRELALLHSLLVESFKGVSEEGKSRFSRLNNILLGISSTLDNMPNEQQRQCLNNNNSLPIHIDETSRIHSNRPSSSTVPPFTPTTVAHPASPVKILPAECTDFPTTSAYVSMISQSLSSAATPFKNYHHRSTPASESLAFASSDFPNGPLPHFGIPESNVLNPSVRRAAVPLDEQQIDRDWKKIIEAAVQSSEGNGSISLVDFSANATTYGDLNYSTSNPVIGSCSENQQSHLKHTTCSESLKPLSFNNPTYSRNHHHHSPPSFTPSGKASKYSSKGSVTPSVDHLKLSRNLNGAPRTGQPSRVNNLRTPCTQSNSGNVSSSPYRSNSSDSIVNCKENTEKTHKTLTSPLSSSTPRINKSSESKKMWPQSSVFPLGTSTRSSAGSKSFDETSKPTSDLASRFTPHSSSSSSSEHALSKLNRPCNTDHKGGISTNLKSSCNVSQSPRRQTVHYEVSPISTPASPKPGFGTLPLQSLKGSQLHGSSSSPRLQASCSPLASSRLQHSGHIGLAVAQSPSRRAPPEEEQDLDSKQRSHQKGQLRAHNRMPSQTSPSPSATASGTAAPIAESQQVASTRSSSIQTALQRQRYQNRQQQWNSVPEFDRPYELRAMRSNPKIVESPLESQELSTWNSFHPVDFQCSQPRPLSSSSQSSSAGRGSVDPKPIDPKSPTSVNHARRLEFFNAGITRSREDPASGFERRDSTSRNSSTFGRLNVRQRDEAISSPSNNLMVSHLRAPAGRSSPSSFISLTNQNRRTSKQESVQTRQMISLANQQQSVLVYNLENNNSEPIICKSTSC